MEAKILFTFFYCFSTTHSWPGHRKLSHLNLFFSSYTLHSSTVFIYFVFVLFFLPMCKTLHLPVSELYLFSVCHTYVLTFVLSASYIHFFWNPGLVTNVWLLRISSPPSPPRSNCMRSFLNQNIRLEGVLVHGGASVIFQLFVLRGCGGNPRHLSVSFYDVYLSMA